MRGRSLVLPLLAAVVACGSEEGAAGGDARTAWPVDGFLALLPADVSLTVRLPSLAAVRERPEVFRRLLQALGRGGEPVPGLFGAKDPAGLAAGQNPGLAVGADGGWVLYLPADDKGALNRALRPLLGERTLREEGRWITLAPAGRAPGDRQGEPLPPGDLAVRVSHHALLAAVAQPGDVLELGCDAGGAGLRLRGRLRPGPASSTGETVARARPGVGGLIELIPSGLGVRVETTLPLTALAGLLTRRVAVHGGVPGDGDRDVLERFVREILTGADGEAGLGLGIDFHGTTVTFVAVGRIGPGGPSPILAKLRQDERTTFGALVLDRRDAPQDVIGWEAWLVEPQPRLAGLPESLWPLAGALASGEDAEAGEGLALAYTEWEGWFAAGLGPRADLLVRSVRRRLQAGGSLSAGSWELRTVRAGEEGDYVLGAVLAGEGFGGLARADRAALRRVFGAGPDAGVSTIVIAAHRRDDGLALTGVVRY